MRNSPWVMLIVLICAYVCSGADRALLALIIQPLELDLQLSDTQVGLLQGLAFLLVYSVAGLPLGLLVDRVHRIRLIMLGIAAWSAMTLAFGMSRTFGCLFLARAGVAIGEATLSPAAFSLLGDAFPARRQGLVIALYQSATGLAGGALLALSGPLLARLNHAGVSWPLVGTLAPWQALFVIFGCAGLFIAPLVGLAREPVRLMTAVRGSPRPQLARVREFYALHRRTIVLHHVAVGLTGFVVNACITWGAQLPARAYGWGASGTSLVVGLLFLTGSLGLLGGGLLSDRLAQVGSHRRLAVCGGAGLAGAAIALALPFASSAEVTVALLAAIIFFAGAPYGAALAALQSLADSRIRGAVCGLFLLAFSLVSALGPISIGWLNTQVFPQVEGIRSSLGIAVPMAFLLSAGLFLLLVPCYRRALLLAAPAAAQG